MTENQREDREKNYSNIMKFNIHVSFGKCCLRTKLFHNEENEVRLAFCLEGLNEQADNYFRATVHWWWLYGQKQRRPNNKYLLNETFQLINRLCKITTLMFISHMVIDISKGKSLLVVSPVASGKKKLHVD